MLVPYPLSPVHNTLGVPTSNLTISPGDNIQDAVDKISTNGGGTVFLNVGTYIVDYFIDVPSNVYILGASRSATIIDFNGGAFSIRSVGTLMNQTVNISLRTFTVINSAGSAVYLQYNNNSEVNGVDVSGCLIGFEFDNVTATGIVSLGTVCENNGTGAKFTNCVATSVYFSTFDNGGIGLDISDTASLTIFDTEVAGNTGIGITLTNTSTIAFISINVDDNGDDGLKLVSGCNNLTFESVEFGDNAGYGVNIANADCNNNIFVTCSSSGNSSGAFNDSGTGTLASATVNYFI